MCRNCGYDGTYRCIVVHMVVRLIYLSVRTVAHLSVDALTGRGAVIRKRSRIGQSNRCNADAAVIDVVFQPSHISRLLLAAVGECVTARKTYGAVPCLSVVLCDVSLSS